MFRYLLCLIVLIPVLELKSQSKEGMIAKIILDRNDIFVQVNAVVENNEHIYKNELTYQLLILKREGNSNSYDKEERVGEFNILPNEKKSVASLKLNLKSDEEVKIFLFVRYQKTLLAQDVVVMNEVEKIYQNTTIKEDQIEIKGLVIDDVKTKIGKDFYDIFYQKYLQSGEQYAFVINVNEKPFIGGRGSLVSVEIGDNKIFEFQARPDEELLVQAAEYTLTLINNYSKSNKNFEKIY